MILYFYVKLLKVSLWFLFLDSYWRLLRTYSFTIKFLCHRIQYISEILFNRSYSIFLCYLIQYFFCYLIKYIFEIFSRDIFQYFWWSHWFYLLFLRDLIQYIAVYLFNISLLTYSIFLFHCIQYFFVILLLWFFYSVNLFHTNVFFCELIQYFSVIFLIHNCRFYSIFLCDLI